MVFSWFDSTDGLRYPPKNNTQELWRDRFSSIGLKWGKCLQRDLRVVACALGGSHFAKRRRESNL